MTIKSTMMVLAAALCPVMSMAQTTPPTTAPTTMPADNFTESDPVKLTPGALKRFDVRTEPVGSHRLTESFRAPARIALDQETTVQVGSVVAGRVIEAKVRAGDTVKKGDVLLVIESPELGESQSEYLQRRTELAVAGSNLEVARSSYQRAKTLLDKSEGIALSEVQKREGELRAAEGAQRAATGAAAAAENKLKLLGMDAAAIPQLETSGIDTRYAVRAPLGGRVVERSITLGELVKPERESLLVIADLSTLWVLIDVPEGSLSEVGTGSKVSVTLPALKGKTTQGEVSYIAPKLDEATRTVSVRVEIHPGELNVLPGMFAEAEVSAPTTGDAVLAVPEAAVQTVEGNPSVFVPVKGVAGAFVARRITAGPTINGMVTVLSGLRSGELIVASGSFILKAELGKGVVQEE